jgi:type II secretory pathway pseudopilin PulG
MKTNPTPTQGRRGFSLLELTGAVVITAALCAILARPIYGIVDDARLASDLKSIAQLREATEEYFKVKGTFAGPNGSVLTWSNNAYEFWDQRVLLRERFLDRKFTTKLGTDSYIRLVRITTSGAAITSQAGQVGHLQAFNCNNGLYNLTGQYAANRLPGARLDAYALARPPGPPPATGDLPATLKRFRPQPFLACYDLPSGTDPPPPVPGGGTAPPDPQYGSYDPYSARTVFAAADASNPVIVAELVMENVRVGDAYRLSVAMEGYAQSVWAYWDVLGRVKYDMYDVGVTQTQQRGIVFIYLGRVPIR